MTFAVVMPGLMKAYSTDYRSPFLRESKGDFALYSRLVLSVPLKFRSLFLTRDLGNRPRRWWPGCRYKEFRKNNGASGVYSEEQK